MPPAPPRLHYSDISLAPEGVATIVHHSSALLDMLIKDMLPMQATMQVPAKRVEQTSHLWDYWQPMWDLASGIHVSPDHSYTSSTQALNILWCTSKSTPSCNASFELDALNILHARFFFLESSTSESTVTARTCVGSPNQLSCRWCGTLTPICT